MVKQIRNGKLVEELMERGDGYFHWLQRVSGLNGPLSSMLADTVFVSVDGIDDILKGKAKEETRRRYSEQMAEKENLNEKETDLICRSIRGDCCLLEVMVCLAYSLNEMFEDADANDGCEHFFRIMMANALLDRYDEEDWDMREEEVRAYWQKHIDMLMKREYSSSGGMSFFPLAPVNGSEVPDRRTISLWQQMNDWVDQHTDEDGEWVD